MKFNAHAHLVRRLSMRRAMPCAEGQVNPLQDPSIRRTTNMGTVKNGMSFPLAGFLLRGFVVASNVLLNFLLPDDVSSMTALVQ
jgi:hypothetical protein